MERQERKPTRLGGYDYSHDGAYFVTICTKDRRNILCDIVGGGALDAPQIRLTPIGEIVDTYIRSTNRIPSVTVDKYVIMPNHIHLILIIRNEKGTSRAPSPTGSRPNQAIPHAVSTLKRFVNRDVGYNVWQRSFHDHVIRGEQDYLDIWRYVDENPYQWQEDCFYTPDASSPIPRRYL